MAEFTILLRTLLQTDFIPALDDYPIFDEGYRAALNNKILNHYSDYEIGLETPDLFNHYLANKMEEIMPYYNELYRVQALIANPFHNFEQTETMQRNIAGEVDEDTSANSSTKYTKGKVSSHSAQSDTPQSNLTPYNVASGGYASLVNMSETESDEDNTSGTAATNSLMRNTTAEDYIKSITGATGINKPEILKAYKSAFTNIDREIINSLRDLFMIVY